MQDKELFKDRVMKKIIKKLFNKKSASQAELEYLVREGLSLGKNVRIHSEYPFDSLFPWLISVGNNVCISSNVKILAHDTSTEYVNDYTKIGIVEIHDNVYIGYGTIILCNTRIGENSIIGAGSVVTHDVPANCVYSGVPAKYICTVDEFKQKHTDNLKDAIIVDGPVSRWKSKTIEEKKIIKERLKDNFGYMK